MDFTIQVIEGVEYLIVTRDDRIHQMPMEAIASWGLLLGLTNPSDIVAAILRNRETPVAPGEPNMWTPLYDALDEGLHALAASGVPPEHMPTLLDPELGAPVPGPDILDRMAAAQQESLATINSHPDEWGALSSDLVAVLDEKVSVIDDAKVAFLDRISPVYELPQTPPPATVEEAITQLNLRTDGIGG
jgi:hypothetical protein